jgi:hypothetical protein
MIRYFSTGYFSRYIAILVLACTLWVPMLFYPNSDKVIDSLGYDFIELIFSHNPYLLAIIAFLVTLISGFLLNYFSIESGISGKVSTLVFAIYILLSASQSDIIVSAPIIWVNILMIFVWSNINRIPNSPRGLALIFNAAFLVGLVSLFFFQFVFFALLIFSAIIVHRVVSIRSLLVTITGVLAPYFFLLVWLFFINDMETFYAYFQNVFVPDISVLMPDTILNIVVFFVVSAITVLSVFGLVGKLGESNINLRRNLLLTVIYLVLGLLIIILFRSGTEFYFVLSVPATVIISNWLSALNNVKWYNYSLTLLLLLMIVNNYYSLVLNILGEL